MQQLNETDALENTTENTEVDVKKVIKKLTDRKNTYETYLEKLTENGETQMSPTDPDARLMKGAKGFDVSYNVQTAVDSKNKLIAESNVTNEGNDQKQLTEMATSAAEILEAPDITAVADTGYNSASEIVMCIESGITTHVAGSEGAYPIPCEAHEAQEITSHNNGKGIYLKERNVFICPMGNIMLPKHYKSTDRTGIYYNYRACSNCTCRCTKVKYRTFALRMKKKDFTKEHSADNLYVKQIHMAPDPAIIEQRKAIVEHPFGTIKRTMDAGYLLTKGKQKVTGEFSLVFLAYNMKRVINIMGAKKLIDAMA